MKEYIVVGKIVNTHGLKGEVKLMPYTDDINRFFDFEYIYIDDASNEKLYFTNVKIHQNLILATFSGYDDINLVEKYKGKNVKIERKDAAILPEGSYFIVDLIGCTVFNTSDDELGNITDVIQTGSNDVYIIKGKNKEEILVAAIKDVVKSIDIENKKIVIEPQEEY